MVIIGGRYFLSNLLLRNLHKAKKEKNVSPSSILLYILNSISAKSNKKMKFFGTYAILQELEKEWEQEDYEPAIKRKINWFADSKKYNTEEENILDVVSDIALSEAPNPTLFLVDEGEKELMITTNNSLGFIGFVIKTPEEILFELDIFPFKSNMMGKITQTIEEY